MARSVERPTIAVSPEIRVGTEAWEEADITPIRRHVKEQAASLSIIPNSIRIDITDCGILTLWIIAGRCARGREGVTYPAA
jgi:hypothetical protein